MHYKITCIIQELKDSERIQNSSSAELQFSFNCVILKVWKINLAQNAITIILTQDSESDGMFRASRDSNFQEHFSILKLKYFRSNFR